ncbi:hypothetical protein CSC94_12935 [Zhengella mangrovi]|uniref:GGDEF domain-containing protein n=1 Tax=Zhengella mangrovi TaxID=1982044 RepID=A0A2G1QM26_9HYPH|nr:GGDEF domain-containing protein [Zhengella mangrovi]PHP66585.1 hypothetical protein CSC94_12935 [Zhengella mangrovi]
MAEQKAYRGIYMAAFAIVFGFVAATIFVVDLASREADRFSLESQVRMVRLEFERARDLALREQAEISNWDKAVDALVKKPTPDAAFVRDEMAGWIGEDFGFSRIAVVTPRGDLDTLIRDNQVLPDARGSLMVDENLDLLHEALTLFTMRRVRAGKGWYVPDEPGKTSPAIHASAWRMIDGIPGLVTAQVITPEQADLAIRDGQVRVLMAFKPLTAPVLAAVSRRLDVADAQVLPLGAGAMAWPNTALADDVRPDSLAFAWRPHAPRPAIIANTAPAAVVLLVFIAVTTGFLVRRHAATVRALADSESRNRFLAEHDPLTGLANRACLDARVAALIGEDKTFAIACIDLDRFKAINDTRGHEAGDAVLCEVARRFADCVEPNGYVARIGGDEFIAVITAGTSPEELAWMGDMLVDRACDPIAYGGETLRIGASVGVAVFPDHGRSRRDLVATADAALYRAKDSGRGRVMLASLLAA